MSKNDGGELASRVASPGEPYRDLRVNPTPGGDPEHECTFDFGDGTVCGFEAYIVSPGYGGVGWNGEAWCDDHDPRSGAKPGAAGDGTPSLSKTEGEGGAPPTSAASLDEVLPVVAVGDKYLIQVTATVESIDGDLVHFSTETELWLRLFQAAVQSQQGAIRAFNAKPAEGGTPSPNPCLYALYAVLGIQCVWGNSNIAGHREKCGYCIAIAEIQYRATKAYEEALSGASLRSGAEGKEERQ